jgi:hypothetical protein
MSRLTKANWRRRKAKKARADEESLARDMDEKYGPPFECDYSDCEQSFTTRRGLGVHKAIAHRSNVSVQGTRLPWSAINIASETGRYAREEKYAREHPERTNIHGEVPEDEINAHPEFKQAFNERLIKTFDWKVLAIDATRKIMIVEVPLEG